MKRGNGILALCVAASILEEQEASALQKGSASAEGTHGKSRETEIARKLKETYQAKVKFDYVPCSPKIPNHLVAEYIENTSDELRKRFSYKCRFSPNTCSKVVESYGSEVKAYSEIKQHIWNHHIIGDSNADLTESKQGTSNNSIFQIGGRYNFYEPKKRISSKTAKTVSEEVLNKGQSYLQESTEKEESVYTSINPTYVERKVIVNFMEEFTLKSGCFEHDYAKNRNEAPTVNPLVHDDRQNRNQRFKTNASEKWCMRELQKAINGDSYSMPSIIRTAPFPFVYTPDPPEPAQVVELHSNGNPVYSIDPANVKYSASRIPSDQAVENKVTKKKSKFARMVCTSRSVLECVENRVTCKSNASSEQNDALEPDNSIENSENVEKSIHEIAWRNIRILSQQRRKRKYRDKPSVYICEICNKHFTANTSLTYHYLGHLKIKPFKCHICCRTFTRRHSLKYHMMIHANKNRFQCSTCKRLFRHPSHYKEHLRKHTGEEPYSCKFCSNKFKTRNSFKRHLKMQHQKMLTSNGIVPICDDN